MCLSGSPRVVEKLETSRYEVNSMIICRDSSGNRLFETDTTSGHNERDLYNPSKTRSETKLQILTGNQVLSGWIEIIL